METTSVELAPPSDISAQHVSDLLRDLDFGGRAVEILGYKKPSVVLSSGDGSGGGQLLQWVLTINQTGAWEWMAAFLTGYAGKEFLKGFAGEAGKDFWKAVKVFASRVSGDHQLDSKAKHQINISTKDNSGKPSISLKIDPSWFGSVEHSRIVRVLEEVMLPSLARFLDSSGRQEPNQPEILDVYIKPIRKKPLGWELRVMRRASPWEIEVHLREAPIEIEWDTRDGTLDWRSKALLNEFSIDGVDTARQVNIFTRRYRPRLIVALGMCCGFNRPACASPALLGDVLIARESASWEEGKYAELTGNKRVFRNKAVTRTVDRSIGPAIVACVEMSSELIVPAFKKYLRLPKVKRALEAYADEMRPIPDVKYGLIVSGSSVVADSTQIDEVIARHPEAIGLEMEIFGIYTAAEKSIGPKKPAVIGIKGVADFGDGSKHDKVQAHASVLAFYTLLALLRKFYGDKWLEIV